MLSRVSSSSRARWVPGLLFLASLGALATAFISEHYGGLAPCVLCLYQRWAYAAVIMLSVAALGLTYSPTPWTPAIRGLVALCGVALVVGAGIAFFHVGVEQHWWEGTQACVGVDLSSIETIEELRAQLMAAPVVRCDEVAWSLFGISMAGYNVIASLSLALASITGLRWMMEKEN